MCLRMWFWNGRNVGRFCRPARRELDAHSLFLGIKLRWRSFASRLARVAIGPRLALLGGEGVDGVGGQRAVWYW
jgi:hypothetical protein